MKIIILAGGIGTRLWPYSKKSLPKQFLSFGEKETLFQQTLRRYISRFAASDILVVTHSDYATFAQEQACSIDPLLRNQILLEPERKSTTGAIALAIQYFEEIKGISENENVLIVPSDHSISPEEVLFDALTIACNQAAEGYLVAFGIRPTRFESGYGYIKTQLSDEKDVLIIEKFVEKPSSSQAPLFYSSEDFLWNSGMLLFQMGIFWEELQQCSPDIFRFFDQPFDVVLKNYGNLPSISIDYALLEKTSRGRVIPLNLDWTDLGSWDSLHKALPKDLQQNIIRGNVCAIESKNCLAFGEEKLICLIGLEDVTVIDHKDALLIVKKGHSDKIKALLEQLNPQKS